MANPALLAQLQQLAGQLNTLQQAIGNLQASNTTLTTKISLLQTRPSRLKLQASQEVLGRCRQYSGNYEARGASGVAEIQSSNSDLLYTCRRRYIFLDFSESGKPLKKIRKLLQKAEIH
jgi:hypothetical protein